MSRREPVPVGGRVVGRRGPRCEISPTGFAWRLPWGEAVHPFDKGPESGGNRFRGRNRAIEPHNPPTVSIRLIAPRGKGQSRELPPEAREADCNRQDAG